MWNFPHRLFDFFVARSFGKHCPSFSKTLPVLFKNVARAFQKRWATNFNPLGNGFCAYGQRICVLVTALRFCQLFTPNTRIPSTVFAPQ